MVKYRLGSFRPSCLSFKFVLSILAACLIVVPTRAYAAECSWRQCVRQGDLELSRQNVAAAERHFRLALVAMERMPHCADDSVACMNRLACTLSLEGRTDEAAALYHKSVSVLEKAYGQKSVNLVKTLLALGSIYEACGDHSSAKSLYQRALGISERNYGPDELASASGLMRLTRPISRLSAGSDRDRIDGATPSALLDAPALDASQQLLGGVINRSRKDLLTEKENSDSGLIADFQKEMQKVTAASGASGTMLSTRTQLNPLKSSPKM